MTKPPGSRGVELAVVAAVSIAAIELARLADDPSVMGSFPAIWPLAGIVTAVLLKRDPRQWLLFTLIACGLMVLSNVVLHGGRLLTTVVSAAIFGLQSVATAWVVRRHTDDEHPFSLDRLPHATTLVAAAVLVPFAAGLLAAVVLMQRLPDLILSVWRTWWLAETIGVLVTAPLVLAAMELRRETLSAMRPVRVLEIAVLAIGGAIVAEGVLGARFPPLMQLPAYILPFLLWAVFRFGPGAGSVAVFVVGFLALWHAARGEGPLALYPDTDTVLRTQGGIAIAGATMLLLASVVAERKRVAHERDLLLADLEQALAEIKTLEGFIPICAWCHKVRDDAGFWQQLEKYLDEKTDATFSHSICPTCTQREQMALRKMELGMRDERVTHS
jgi:integral membrane sensor domain MASE1